MTRFVYHTCDSERVGVGGTAASGRGTAQGPAGQAAPARGEQRGRFPTATGLQLELPGRPIPGGFRENPGLYPRRRLLPGQPGPAFQRSL